MTVSGHQRKSKPSHPTRVRGLKSFAVYCAKIDLHVAPHPGAWIEISYLNFLPVSLSSHPTRVRGLK